MIKARTENPGILEAIRGLRRMSMNNPLRLRYEAYLKRVRDEKDREGETDSKSHSSLHN